MCDTVCNVRQNRKNKISYNYAFRWYLLIVFMFALKIYTAHAEEILTRNEWSAGITDKVLFVTCTNYIKNNLISIPRLNSKEEYLLIRSNEELLSIVNYDSSVFFIYDIHKEIKTKDFLAKEALRIRDVYGGFNGFFIEESSECFVCGYQYYGIYELRSFVLAEGVLLEITYKTPAGGTADRLLFDKIMAFILEKIQESTKFNRKEK